MAPLLIPIFLPCHPQWSHSCWSAVTVEAPPVAEPASSLFLNVQKGQFIRGQWKDQGLRLGWVPICKKQPVVVASTRSSAHETRRWPLVVCAGLCSGLAGGRGEGGAGEAGGSEEKTQVPPIRWTSPGKAFWMQFLFYVDFKRFLSDALSEHRR